MGNNDVIEFTLLLPIFLCSHSDLRNPLSIKQTTSTVASITHIAR
jgi:hypothetical protein